MGTINFIRVIARNGQITIPSELRQLQKWEDGNQVEIIMEREGFSVRPLFKNNKLEVIHELESLMEQHQDVNTKATISEAIKYIANYKG